MSFIGTLLTLSACSFSNSGKGEQSANIVKVRQSELPGTSQEVKLSQYAYLSDQEALVSFKLKKQSSASAKEPAFSEASTKRISKLTQMMDLIWQNRLSEANAVVGSEGLSCIELDGAVIYSYMLGPADRNFATYEQFLKSNKCAGSASADLVKNSYLLEIRRQFQAKFTDPSLLKYILHHPHFLGSSMIPLGKSGISVRLRVVMSFWLYCKIVDRTEDEIKLGYYPVDCDINSEDGKLGPQLAFLNALDGPKEYADVIGIKDGRMVLAVPELMTIQTYNTRFLNNLYLYMAGEEVSDEAFVDSILSLMYLENDQA